MQSAISRRAQILLAASALVVALASLAAALAGRPIHWYASAVVFLMGSAATVAVASWLTRRPWHLELAPAAVSLENLQIVPHYYLERLAALGIFTVTSLRRADPERTARGIGATPDMVHRWQARAELHLLELREEVLGWTPASAERWPALVPGTGPFGRGHPGSGRDE